MLNEKKGDTGAGDECIFGGKSQDKNEVDSKKQPGSLTWVFPRVGLRGSSGDAELKKQQLEVLMQTHYTPLDTHIRKHCWEIINER